MANILSEEVFAMADFPCSVLEFQRRFADDAACAAYLAECRWPEGFVCPACQMSTIPWRQTRGRLVCPGCRHQSSASGYAGQIQW